MLAYIDARMAELEAELAAHRLRYETDDYNDRSALIAALHELELIRRHTA